MPKNRKKEARKLKPVLHIYCEGEKTEPNYINQRFPNNRNLIKIEPTKKNTPKQLVDEAVKAKNHKDTPEGDIFWVVYDRESEQKYKESLHKNAYDKAEKNSVNIALSNVCFEVWLLLHFKITVAHYHNYEDLRKNSPLRQELRKKGLKDYEKGNPDIFNIISDSIKNARQRAEKLNKETSNAASLSWVKPYQLNPYTDVYKLLDAIDKFGKQHLSSHKSI